MNDAWLGGGDPDEGVEVDELEGEEQADEGEVVLGAEPAEVQDFVQDDEGLDEDEREGGLFGFGAESARGTLGRVGRRSRSTLIRLV